MEDIIYKAIQVKTKFDNPDEMGLFDTSFGKMLYDGKIWHDINKGQEIHRLSTKIFYWYKKITKDEYLKTLN